MPNPAAINKPNSIRSTCSELSDALAQCLNRGAIFTQAITVAQIMAIPQFDIAANGLKWGALKENISLFAGIKNSVDVKPTDIVYPSLEKS